MKEEISEVRNEVRVELRKILRKELRKQRSTKEGICPFNKTVLVTYVSLHQRYSHLHKHTN